jgi:hypothetical protein
MKIKNIYFVIITLLASISISAQESANTAGGEASGSGGTSSYSLGQTVYTSDTATTGSVNQGVQQVYEISVVIGIEKAEINLSFTAFPNPTTDILNLSIGNYTNNKLSYQLFNTQGKLITKNIVIANTASINMVGLEKSTYILKIIDDKKIIKTFQIIKN